MKKLILIALTALCCTNTQAQGTLTKLIDSTGDWSRLYTMDNKLYLGTYFVEGTQYEVDVNTNALTPVAVFPSANNTGYYESICQDFAFHNGRMARVLHCTNPNGYYLIAADNNSADTIVNGGMITNVSKSANKIFVAVDGDLYTTDLTTANTTLIDSFSGNQEELYSGANYFYYVKQDPSNSSIRRVIRTDGTTSTVLATVNQTSTLIDLIGDYNGDFYYAITLYTSNPTVEFWKSTSSSSPVSLGIFNNGAYPVGSFGSGTAVGLGKIFMMMKSMTAPYPNDLYAFDLTASTLTRLTDAQTTNIQYGVHLNKTTISSTALYFFTSGFIQNMWKSDGTVAGTALYQDSADVQFYDAQYNSFTLSNTGIICDQYPIAGTDTDPGSANDIEYHYGTSTGLAKYNLNPGSGSYPKDLVKIGTDIYFLATESNSQFGKQSMYKQAGCGQPTAITSVNNNSIDVTVSPNPNSGNFSIQGAGVNANTTATLYNMQGQKLNTTNNFANNAIRISTQGLPTGIYLLEVRSEGQVKIEKISVQ